MLDSMEMGEIDGKSATGMTRTSKFRKPGALLVSLVSLFSRVSREYCRSVARTVPLRGRNGTPMMLSLVQRSGRRIWRFWRHDGVGIGRPWPEPGCRWRGRFLLPLLLHKR